MEDVSSNCMIWASSAEDNNRATVSIIRRRRSVSRLLSLVSAFLLLANVPLGETCYPQNLKNHKVSIGECLWL
jgi:hypothetical protein